jgi:tripartite ATP-independent transporter DctM subunit
MPSASRTDATDSENPLGFSLCEPLAKSTEAIGGIALAIDVVIVFASVVWRYFLHSPIDWAEEVAQALMITLVFCGAATGMARGRHVGMELLLAAIPEGARRHVRQFSRWVLFAVSLGIAVSAVELLFAAFSQTTSTGLPQAIIVGPVVFGTAIMTLHALEKALSGPPAVVLRSGLVVALAAAAIIVLPRVAPDLLPSPRAAMGLSLVAGLLAGVPIAFTLGLAALVYFALDPSLPLMIYAQQVVAGVDQFVLLAIPFFLLAGAAMEVNGMSSRLVELIVRGIGHVRGGLNLTIVTAIAFFSGVSGSKLADVAAVGGVLMPAVRRTGHNPSDAAALLAASAVMAEVIPPCVNMIIMGFVANLSIGGLFLAGLIPAAILAVALGTIGVVVGRRIDVGEAYPERTPLPKLLAGGAVGLLMVLMIGKGVVAGIATSTEVSAFAVVYALVVGGLAFRELTLRKLVRLFVDAATLAGILLFIVAAATSLSYTLTMEMIPQDVAAALVAFVENEGGWLFIVLSIVMMAAFGSVLEGAPALIIFGPILVPIAERLGVAPLHYATVLIIAMGLGLFAPPVGLGLYTTCVVCGTTVGSVARPIMKYLVVLVVVLILIAMVPSLTLWLPHRAGY